MRDIGSFQVIPNLLVEFVVSKIQVVPTRQLSSQAKQGFPQVVLCFFISRITKNGCFQVLFLGNHVPSSAGTDDVASTGSCM